MFAKRSGAYDDVRALGAVSAMAARANRIAEMRRIDATEDAIRKIGLGLLPIVRHNGRNAYAVDQAHLDEFLLGYACDWQLRGDSKVLLVLWDQPLRRSEALDQVEVLLPEHSQDGSVHYNFDARRTLMRLELEREVMEQLEE